MASTRRTPSSLSTPAFGAGAGDGLARRWRLERMSVHYARVALGAAFLSAVASRFGLRDGDVSYERYERFVRYTGEVNAFMPAFTIPFLAWSATLAELGLGIALILGLWPRWVALGSALLLLVFGMAMAISQGIGSPLDYSVFSASAAALLLASHHVRTRGASA